MMIMPAPRKYPPELRERALRLVAEARKEDPELSLNAAVVRIGQRVGVNLADAPWLIANYGEGTWVKMQYVLRGNYSNVTVHYFRNLDTGLDVEFKFK
jgi:hypothetical protein